MFLEPAFTAITLGIVGLNQYALQVAKNKAYKHSGTAFSAALSFIFALYYGIGSIFVITALMGVFSLIFLYLIKECDINHKVASGQSVDRALELVAFWLNKSGHINAGFAFVMMLGGIGGALSSTLGGVIAEMQGYLWAYLSLAFVAFIGLIVWLLY